MSDTLAAKSVDELKNIVENHRKRNIISSELYLQAVHELELRQGKGFNLEKTISLVSEATRHRRFVSYKEVAAESKVPSSQLHYGIGRHLGALCRYTHGKGMPLLSAIIVNSEHVKTGSMNEETRLGFIKLAREMGFLITDEDAFLKAEQERVFEYFASGASA